MARIFAVVTLVLEPTIASAQTPPVIVGQPQNQLVIVGSNAVVSVAATGDNRGYQWYFNAIAGATTPTLMLADVQATQAGNYSVSVTNSDATLTVLNASINPYAFGTLGFDLFQGTFEKAA